MSSPTFAVLAMALAFSTKILMLFLWHQGAQDFPLIQRLCTTDNFIACWEFAFPNNQFGSLKGCLLLPWKAGSINLFLGADPSIYKNLLSFPGPCSSLRHGFLQSFLLWFPHVLFCWGPLHCQRRHCWCSKQPTRIERRTKDPRPKTHTSKT